MTVAVVVPAAGAGVRMGPGAPKALRDLAGEPLLVHSVRSVLASGLIDQVVVAAPPDAVGEIWHLLEPCVGSATLSVVPGGASRRASVGAALRALRDDVEIVLVHDAARPLVPVEVTDRVVSAVRSGAAAVVPALPVTDTVKRVQDDLVVETVDRSHLRAVQTPQGFARAILERAHAAVTQGVAQEAAHGARAATDDAGMVEEIGEPVRVVDGAAEALKITHPFDLRVAEAVLRARR